MLENTQPSQYLDKTCGLKAYSQSQTEVKLFRVTGQLWLHIKSLFSKMKIEMVCGSVGMFGRPVDLKLLGWWFLLVACTHH